MIKRNLAALGLASLLAFGSPQYEARASDSLYSYEEIANPISPMNPASPSSPLNSYTNSESPSYDRNPAIPAKDLETINKFFNGIFTGLIFGAIIGTGTAYFMSRRKKHSISGENQ